MSIEEAEARMAAHDTPGGLHVTYDDGQNVRVEGMAPCPWCGPVEGEARRPYVQVRMLGGLPEARAVCPSCFCSTAPSVPDCRTYDAGGRNVTRDKAIEIAVERWNRRAVDDGALLALADRFECGSAAYMTGKEVADAIRRAVDLGA